MSAFWMGHRMLGDVIGFCAAAHLYAVKTSRPVKVWFDPSRRDAAQYFDGVIWTQEDEIPHAVDCGNAPTAAEWPALNGVKRFYRFMDPALEPTKSFDIHFNRPRSTNGRQSSEKLIGLITHSNTQGDIDDITLDRMLAEARRLYPQHRIVSFGNLDNSHIPPGVEDWRQPNGDVNWIIEFVERLDLLITPQSGPCFIAAGWRTPMWVYRSKDSHWDCTLNYDTYQVERWWDRNDCGSFDVFEQIYRGGGWNGMGSGPGSAPEANQEYIGLLNDLINRTPSIQTILDIGCGDWQIMRHVDLSGKQYLGIDVVPSLIAANQHLFGNDRIRFQSLNACREAIPHADLIIMKDVLQHLPNAWIHKLLEQVATRCRWALITNDFAEQNVAPDIQIGDHRPTNVLAPPFNFPGATLGVVNGKHITLSCFDV